MRHTGTYKLKWIMGKPCNENSITFQVKVTSLKDVLNSTKLLKKPHEKKHGNKSGIKYFDEYSFNNSHEQYSTYSCDARNFVSRKLFAIFANDLKFTKINSHVTQYSNFLGLFYCLS